MPERPKRKSIRISTLDYSAPGAYFVTICTKDRENLFWLPVGADIIRPQTLPLSPHGKLVRQAILQIPFHYDHVSVDKYCIMPDHIHLILRIEAAPGGRMVSAPTISVILGSMKRWVSKQAGRPIWQKSFFEHSIRTQQDYD